MTKNLLPFLAGLGLLGCSQAALAQTTGSVGIGTTIPHASAVLDLSATNKGLLIPRLTSAQLTAIASPAEGLLVYCTDGPQPGLWYYRGAAWTYVNPTGADNLGNHTATQNLSLGGNQLVGNGGSTGLSVSSAGNVGLGTTSPQGRLDVASGPVHFPAANGTANTWFNFVADGRNYLRGSTVLADEDANSRVGIGAFTPTEKLEVAGNVKITGSGSGITFADGTRQTTTAQADNLGNHTATQPLNLGTNALVGTGADIGTTVGIGVRADGGLNIGQNQNKNVSVGYKAGAVVTGGQNSFFGYMAGVVTTAGFENSFIGNLSGLYNTTGSYNCFVGVRSGMSSTIGSSNTLVGYYAGVSSNLGDNNTALGCQTMLDGNLTFATAIGSGAWVSRSNSLVLGGTAGNPAAVNVGIGTAAPDATLHIAGATSKVRVEGMAGPGTRLVATNASGNLTAPSTVRVDALAGTGTRLVATDASGNLTAPGTVRVDALAGTGTRPVTADASGNLAAATSSSMLGRLAAAQSGTTDLGSNGFGGPLSYTITFATAFDAPPAQVLVTVRGITGFPDTFAASTQNVTATGFQVNVYRTDSPSTGGTYAQTPKLDWLAIP